MIERSNFLRAGHEFMHGYASKIRLRVPAFGMFCHGARMIERGNFCAGFASIRGYASKLILRSALFRVFSRGILNTFRDHTLKLVATGSHAWPEELYSSNLVTRSRFLVFVS